MPALGRGACAQAVELPGETVTAKPDLAETRDNPGNVPRACA